MKPRLPALLPGLALAALTAFSPLPAVAQQTAGQTLGGQQAATVPAPARVTTTKTSAIAIGSGSFALVKGTTLEVVSREGDSLIVKFRTSQGKIPLADTNYPADAVAGAAPAEAPAKPTPVATATKPAPAQPAKAAPPPALDPAGKPASTYGKAVQKAKQVTGTQKSNRVDPTKDLMDEEPKK